MAVKRANKTVVAWIREIGASGAYWIASGAEHIVANRMSVTGSIGVFGSYLDFSGFIDDWNVSYERLVAGQYKDTGIPFRELEPAERVMLQAKLDMLHEEFKKEIKANRELSDEQLADIAEGEFYLGSEAKALGLVDELGGKKEAIDYIEKKLEIEAELAVYEREVSLFEKLAGMVVKQDFSLGSSVERGSIGSLR
jgi:protease-4